MVFGLYFFWTNDALYHSLFVENKGCAESTHVFASVHAFLTPHTKFFNQFLVSIGNKCEWQLVFLNELLVRLFAVYTYADYLVASFAESTVIVAQIAGLGRTA